MRPGANKKINKKKAASTPAGLLKEAQALEKQGDIKGAIKVFRAYLSKHRSHPQATSVRTRAAQLCVMTGDNDAAADLIRAGGKGAEEDTLLMYTLGQACAYSGRLDEAVEALDKALGVDPDYAPAIARRAAMMQFMGQKDEALSIVDGALQRGVDAWDIDHALGTLAVKAGRTDEAIDRITKRLTDRSIKSMARTELLFVLIDLLEKSGDYKGALEIATEANAHRTGGGLGGYSLQLSKKVTPRQMVEGYKKRIAKTKSIYTPGFIRSLEPTERGPEARPENIFVVGMPRSGTTLLEQIISSHRVSRAPGKRGS